MVWMADPGGYRVWSNAALLAFVGHDFDQNRGAGWLECVHAQDRDRCADIQRHSFQSGRPYSLDYRLRYRDGSYRWVMENGEPRVGPAGAVDCYVGVCVDVHERRSMEDRLAGRVQELRRFERHCDDVLADVTSRLHTRLDALKSASAGGSSSASGSVSDWLSNTSVRAASYVGGRTDSGRNAYANANVSGLIEATARDLGRSVADLESLIEMARYRVALKLEWSTVGELVSLSMQTLAAGLDRAGHTVTIDMPEPGIGLRADVQRLVEAVCAAVQSACGFGDDRMSVSIVVRHDERAAFIRNGQQASGRSGAFESREFESQEFESQEFVLREFVSGAVESGVGRPDAPPRMSPGLPSELTIAQRITRRHGGEMTVFGVPNVPGFEVVMRLPLTGARSRNG